MQRKVQWVKAFELLIQTPQVTQPERPSFIIRHLKRILQQESLYGCHIKSVKI